MEYMLYKDLGVYQLLMPQIDEPYMTAFSERYIVPLLDHDHENKTNLYETAIRFVMSDGDITKTADTMRQHKNTIRYRLEKISGILNENILARDKYERLSMAVKIHTCEQSIQKFRESALKPKERNNI
jgi:DNA-binding PucR family transcriptional regulator